MTPTKHVKKPDWLKIKLGDNEQFTYTKQVLEKHCLHTICTSGRCPNQGECWNRGTATFMIGGDVCTRSCRFCNTKSGRPAPLNPDEPEQLATSVGLMKLKHAVVTSVDRDDLPDFGAAHWVNCIEAIKKRNPDTTLEVLIPDFRGRLDLVDLIIDAGPNVISHNLETVRRLTPSVRSVATYDTSMNVLRHIAASGISAKTGIMLGLGETEAEILELMDEVLAAGVSTITIGQYLQPTRKHLPVSEYVTPEQFEKIRLIGIKKGFKNIECAPLVRSSYHAERHV
ncbi:lipoyl synthase [Porphyromonas macacae]|uniref:Lipoyl synthase n=1 Tax=Porphyromonas macacae TaxID=28115 RepID=A0A0A2E4M1_9PORP|nr:lipoyl synthase [Porphyromonas macacae]KGN72370.1 lipoyl synthase [Porphyromonas macacae]SUB88492.1 Lipoyl synthase [Porphyromonas macacae]